MNKADIVQRLLDEQHITAEEAVILLSTVRLELEPKNPTYHPNPWFGIYDPWDRTLPPNPYTIKAVEGTNKKV
jgi:hypothetical protein